MVVVLPAITFFIYSIEPLGTGAAVIKLIPVGLTGVVLEGTLEVVTPLAIAVFLDFSLQIPVEFLLIAHTAIYLHSQISFRNTINTTR